MEIVNYIVENQLAIYAILTTIVLVAKSIAKLTPTDKDDTIVEKVRLFLEKVGDMFIPDLEYTLEDEE